MKIEDFDDNLTGEDSSIEAENSGWYKRIKKGILTETKEKKDAPEGLWAKCPSCNFICTVADLQENKFVCSQCEHHHRIGSEEYFEILFDDAAYTELFANIISKDHLGFVDLKPYGKRLEETYAKSNIHDSITVAHGKVNHQDLVVACMDF